MNHVSALVSTCPYYVNRHPRTLSNTTEPNRNSRAWAVKKLTDLTLLLTPLNLAHSNLRPPLKPLKPTTTQTDRSLPQDRLITLVTGLSFQVITRGTL